MSQAVFERKYLVRLLYRQMLKESLNWNVDRQKWLKDALDIRMYFDARAHLRDEGRIEYEIVNAELMLESIRHPDGYKIPTNPGGTSFQRNPAPPLFTLYKEPDHPLPKE